MQNVVGQENMLTLEPFWTGKTSLFEHTTLQLTLTAPAVGGSKRWTFSETMDIRDFTVCIIRCVYHAELILGT